MLSGCSRARTGQVARDVSKEPSRQATDFKESPIKPAPEPCKLDSEPVTVEIFPNRRVVIPRYVLTAHEAAEKARNGVGYKNGQNWTYELELPTCDPKHPKATISFVAGERFGSFFGEAKSLVEKRINYGLDKGNCFGSRLVYYPDQLVTISVERRRAGERTVNPERTKCVYQAFFDRETDGVTFRDITVLSLHYYEECKACIPGHSATVMQLAVAENDWPYLKEIVNRMIETYTVDWAYYAKFRTKEHFGRE